MPLDDLNKKLYDPASGVDTEHVHEQSLYDPLITAKTEQNSPFEEEPWHPVQKGLTAKGKRNLWIAIVSFLLIALAIGGFYGYRWWQKNAFHQDRVAISFEGPKEADSTQLTKYIIHYQNDNRVTLKNSEIQLAYSENFQPTDNLNLKNLSPTASKIFVGDIKPMSQGTIELKGVFYAPKDYPVYLRGSLHFMPSNGAQELNMDNQIAVNITAAPVGISVGAPQEAVDGDSLQYVIDYKNLDTRRMNDLQIRVDFPQGFKMSSATPKPSEKEAYWYVGALDPGQGGKIIIEGQINGSDSENKNIIVSLGHIGADNKFIVFSKQESNTEIVTPLLAIKQSLDEKTSEVITAGEVLKYSIAFQNTGSIGLRDAIVTAEVKGRLLDFSNIKVEGGSYNGQTGIITWKASDVPQLANINPKEGGQVHFSVPVKTVIPVENSLDKNFVITSIAKIDSPDIPTPIDSNKIIGSNKLELKLASKVLFNTRAYFNDTKLKNVGPIPLQTGLETTFSVHWSVVNVSNDLSGAKIISSLPSGVRWVGNVYPTNENITYNTRTNQLIWDAGDIPAGAGALNPSREIIFQVGVTPQINQVGNPLTLVNKSVFTARDTFVNQDVTLSGEVKDTQLAEDPAVGFMNGKVAK